MKTLKQKRESLVATNKSIQDKNKLLKTAKQKLKRVDLKVCINKQLPLLGTLSKTVSLQNSLFKNNKKLCSIRCRANQSRFCGTMFKVE